MLDFDRHIRSVIIIFIVIGINLLILNTTVFNLSKRVTVQSEKQASVVPQIGLESECAENCREYIDKSIASLSSSLITKTETAQTATQQMSAGAREYFIPLGQGSTNSDEWTDVPGVQSYIDVSRYGTIQTLTFEASATNPTSSQTINIRLYNVTDKHPVWLSDLTTNGDSKLVGSSPIALDQGNKLYQVQMKTQLRATATLIQSRVHIITY